MKPNFKKKIALFFMWLLTVANLIAFYFQPSSFSIFNKETDKWARLGTLLMTPVVFGYVLLVIAGLISLIKILYPILRGQESSNLTKVTVSALLISLLAISYGTFLKKSYAALEVMEVESRSNQWENEHVLLKYGGGKEICRSNCILRGDTIIHRADKLKIDTLVLDKSNNTCYWTYKPMVNYRIDYFNDNLFTQDADDKTFCPLQYDERIQYVINQVNNKHKDEFNFYTMDGVDEHIKNDTIMCFLFETSKHDATHRLGYLYFSIKNNVAILKDSCSDIYRLIDYPKDKDYRESSWWPYPSEYDLPLLRSCYRKEKLTNNDFIQYGDYFDILQKKPVIINCPDWIEYWDTTAKSLNYTTTKFESRHKDSDYPIIDYYTTFRASKHSSGPPDTLEIGRYVMRNGEYVKDVLYQKK